MLFATAEVGTGFPSAVLQPSEGIQVTNFPYNLRSARVEPKLFRILITLAAELNRVHWAGRDGIDSISYLQLSLLSPILKSDRKRKPSARIDSRHIPLQTLDQSDLDRAFATRIICVHPFPERTALTAHNHETDIP